MEGGGDGWKEVGKDGGRGRERGVEMEGRKKCE